VPKERTRSDVLAARREALSPKPLLVLTGLFAAAFAVLILVQMREEMKSRRTETALRVEAAAGACSAALNVAIMTGASSQQTLAQCRPGGAASVYLLSANGDVLAAVGAERGGSLDAATARALDLATQGGATLDLSNGPARSAWRPLDNGDALLVLAPQADIFARTPIWISYALGMAAIGLVLASLIAAFLKQNRIAAEAAGAVGTLELYSAALSGGRCSPWFFDVKARTVTFSRTLLEPLNLGPRDRVFGLREMSALAHPEDFRSCAAILTGEGGTVSEGRVRLREPGGGWSQIYLRSAPGPASPIRSGIAFDLSGAAGQAPGAAMAESRLKDAIESISEAFVLWDAQGRLAVWNKRFAAIFRFPEQALRPGLSASETAALARARGDIIAGYFAPESPIDGESAEVELPGDRFVRISRRRTSEGGLVCVASNVTDLKRRARAQKRKERELKATVDNLERSQSALSDTMHKYELEKRRAEDASRSKSEFLANMSHELRTPLNAINGFSEIMKSELYGPLGDEKYKEYVDDILSSGRHLLELIDDILDMSKIEAGKFVLQPKRVEFDKILQECVRLVAKRAADAGVRLTASVGHAPAAFADARAAKQVTLNLLSNAVKFAGRGGEVAMTAEADLDGVTVVVADSGPGIEKSRLRKLGAPFALAEDHFSKRRDGTGLGLALSKSLMEMQGGILAIASEPGKGTVACAAFPRRKEARVRLPQFLRANAHVLTGPQPRAASEAAE